MLICFEDITTKRLISSMPVPPIKAVDKSLTIGGRSKCYTALDVVNASCLPGLYLGTNYNIDHTRLPRTLMHLEETPDNICEAIQTLMDRTTLSARPA